MPCIGSFGAKELLSNVHSLNLIGRHFEMPKNETYS